MAGRGRHPVWTAGRVARSAMTAIGTLRTVRTEVFASRRKRLRQLAAGVGLTVATAFMMLLAAQMALVVVGAVGVVFFGCTTCYLVAEVVRPRPVFQIDAAGVVDRSSFTAAGRLAWSEITNVRILVIGRQRMLAITTRDPQAVLDRVGASGASCSRRTCAWATRS